ncbi:MAG TPA: SGNH/GDSL hydrolase family protein [Daejeonella sp.]|nr:SGNH/GDSL hydrolase family protein [Daejeonella sp.]
MNKTYLALGDSYTIGEAVSSAESFPFQLVEELKKRGQFYAQPAVIAQTGWTTDELMEAIRSKNLSGVFDLVTLLIGVNNQYRGYPLENYRKEFKALLQTALNYAGGIEKNVLVISIPDWGVTPFAQKSDRDLQQISEEIDVFNAINREESLKAGITYVDITPGSRKALADIFLLAEDGLHPSGKMYAEWVEQIIKGYN